MKNKFFNLLLAIVIALGLWAYVITSVSPGSKDTIYNILVAMEGKSVLEENGLIITGISTDRVDLTLSGTRRDLSKVNPENITLKVDLTKITEPGKHSLTYDITYPGDVPRNAFVEEARDPQSIVFTVEKRVHKSIPVEVKFLGSLPEGFLYDRENLILDNHEIVVTGPASEVDQIAKAVIEVDLSSQRESISQTYTYSLCDAEGNGVDAKLITTNVEQVRLDLKIQRFKNVNLVYTVIPGGGAAIENAEITLSVDTIQVSGSEAALNDLGDEIVIGTFRLEDYPENTTLTKPITLPEGITNLSGITEVKVEISFVGLRTKNFILENIEAINVPEGMEAEIAAKQVALRIRGAAALMSQLAVEDIYAYIDFTGAELGSTTYKVSIRLPEEYSALGVVSVDSVKVTLLEAEKE